MPHLILDKMFGQEVSTMILLPPLAAHYAAPELRTLNA